MTKNHVLVVHIDVAPKDQAVKVGAKGITLKYGGYPKTGSFVPNIVSCFKAGKYKDDRPGSR